LIRVAENTTGDTWRNLRHELDRMHLVTPAGAVAQRSALIPGQKAILEALDVPNHHGSSTSPPPPAEKHSRGSCML